MAVVTVYGKNGRIARIGGNVGGNLTIGEVKDRPCGGQVDDGTSFSSGAPASPTPESQLAHNPILVAMAMGRSYQDALAEQRPILRPQEAISEATARKALGSPKKTTYRITSKVGVVTHATRPSAAPKRAAAVRPMWKKGDIYKIKYYDLGPGGLKVRREYHATSVVRWYGYTNGYWYYGVNSNIQGKVADGPNSMDQLGYNTSWYSGNRRYESRPSQTIRGGCSTQSLSVTAGPVSISNSGQFCPSKTDPWVTYNNLGFGALWDAGWRNYSRDWRQAHATAAIQHTPGASMTFYGHPRIGWQN